MTKAKGPEPPCPKRAASATKTNPTSGAFQISDDRFHRLPPQSRRRGLGHQTGGWVQSQALGGGTHPQLAEPIPAHPGALGEVPRELHRLSSFRLPTYRPQSRRVIRIGSKSNDWFEDYIGDLIEKLGCRIRRHPPVGDRLADYLAVTPDGHEFFVESTEVTPIQFSAERPTETDVCNKLNNMCCAQGLYEFVLTAEGELYQNLPATRLRVIQDWVLSLETDPPVPTARRFAFPSGLPSKDKPDPSPHWVLNVDAYPRSAHLSGKPSLLFAGVGRGGGVDSVDPLTRAARAKVQQHTAIDAPLLLDMNDKADFQASRPDVSLALFGWERSAETGISGITPPSSAPRRRSNWGRGENRNISAILLFRGLSERTVHYTEFCLFPNPEARYPIPLWVNDVFPSVTYEETDGVRSMRWPPDERLSSVPGTAAQSRPFGELEEMIASRIKSQLFGNR